MATEEVLHILISPETYKMGKSNILMSHANFLEILKKLYNLEILARQKQDLRKRLHKLFASILSDIDSIQNNILEINVAKQNNGPAGTGIIAAMPVDESNLSLVSQAMAQPHIFVDES